MLNVLPLLFILLPQAPSNYGDQIWKKGTEESIKCKINRETCKGIEYFIKAAGSIQEQKLDADSVVKVEYEQSRESSNFNRGMKAMEEQKFKEAVPLFDRAIRDWTKDPAQQQYAFYYKALAHQQAGEFKEATKAFDDLLSVHSETKFLKDVHRNRFESAFRARDMNGAKTAADKFEADARKLGVLGQWQGEVDMLRAKLFESQNDWPKARAVYEKYENDRNPDVAEDATLGVLKCLRAMNNASDLYTKCSSLVSSAKSPRVLTAAYNGVGDQQLRQSSVQDAMLSYLRGVVQYRVPGTPEHEYALFGSVTAMSRYAASQQAEKKETYKQRAMRNLGELKGLYPKSSLIAEAMKEIAKIK